MQWERFGRNIGQQPIAYDNHITKTVSSCFSRLAQINRVKHAFNKKTLINSIYTLVLSKL